MKNPTEMMGFVSNLGPQARPLFQQFNNSSVNRRSLKSWPALLGFISAYVAHYQRAVVALQGQLSVSGDRVIRRELQNGQRIEHNPIIRIVRDGISAQAVEDRTQVNQNTGSGVAGNVDPAVDVGVRMVGDFNSALEVAADFGGTCPLAMAGFTTVHAPAGIG